MVDIRLENDKKHHEIHNHKHHIYGNRDSIFCDSDRKCADKARNALKHNKKKPIKTPFSFLTHKITPNGRKQKDIDGPSAQDARINV